MPLNCQHIADATDKDVNLSKVKEYIRNGIPSKLEPELSSFNNIINELSVLKGCIMYRNRVYIPESIRKRVLQQLHLGHPGVSGTKSIARSILYFPGMDKYIENLVMGCSICQANQSKPAQNNTVQWPPASRKWGRIHIDHLFFEGSTLLIVVDSYSKYIECVIVASTSGACTVDALREIFSRNGIPDVCVSDNASSYTCFEFKKFCADNFILHMTPAPYCPFSNGLAEKSVFSVKNLLKKNNQGSLRNRLSSALLYYRSTPHSVTKIAPSVALNDRKLITLRDRVNPNFCTPDPLKCEGEQRKIKSFNKGDQVLALNLRPGPKWYTGVIVDKLGVNIYEVFINELDILWRRHAYQLKATCVNKDPNNPLDRNNDVDLSFTSFDKLGNSGNNVPNSSNSEVECQSGSDDSLSETSVAANDETADDGEADRILPRRSGRIRKPVERLNL